MRDLRDLLVRLAFELTEDKHRAVMFRQLCDGRIDQLAKVTLAEEVVRTRTRVLELERTLLLILPRLANRLEQHERVA